MRVSRSLMAAFIRRIASDDYTDSEWADLMPTHYQDIPTENARRRTVEICLGYSDVPPEEKRQVLLMVAEGLEQHLEDFEFYFHSEAVGVLEKAPEAEGESEIGYEPYRGPGHYELQRALREGQSAICEYMQLQERKAFVVLGCPCYGRLTICVKSASA